MIPEQLSPVANHLWQSTLFAGMTAFLSLALRKNRAHIRHALWLAASAKFLIPFSLLVAVGSQFEWRGAPSVAVPLSSAIEQIGQPFDGPSRAPAPEPAAPASSHFIPALLLAVWFAGCGAVLTRWWIRWQRIVVAARAASPRPIHAPVKVKSSPTLLEPGVFGLFRPAILLPEGIEDRLTPEQAKAILAHELCHIRRRDNLAAALHMVVEAVFWFHPLVWWIGARLVEERERACDEEVLRQGSEPEVYAAGILNVCRFYVESPLACAPGVTGADLEKRIEEIMSNRILPGLTFTRKLLLAASGIAAVAIPTWIGIVNAPELRAQGQSATSLKFEVASIKPVKGDAGKGMLQNLPGGGLRMGNVTLRGLIAFAYGIQEDRISGGSGWVGSDAYELLAKPERSEAADNPQMGPAPGNVAWSRLEQRLQSLLAERFRLVIHTNTKEVSGYALVPAKGGAKVPPSADGDSRPAGTMRGRGRIDGRNGTMTMLATVLSNMLGSPVADRTGLTGTYTYKLEYSQDFGGGGGKTASEAPTDANAADTAPSIFSALQEQLGLKLESSRVPLQSIVIDRAEKPSAN